MLLKKTTVFISVIFNLSLLQLSFPLPPKSPPSPDDLINATLSHSEADLEKLYTEEFRSELTHVDSYNRLLISLSKIKHAYHYIFSPYNILPCERELLTADVSLFSIETNNNSHFKKEYKLSLFGFFIQKANALHQKNRSNTFNVLNELFSKKRFTILIPPETSPSRITQYHPSQINIESDRFYPDLYQIKQAICQDMNLEQSTMKTLDDLISEIINFDVDSISISTL